MSSWLNWMLRLFDKAWSMQRSKVQRFCALAATGSKKINSRKITGLYITKSLLVSRIAAVVAMFSGNAVFVFSYCAGWVNYRF
jgi:hypothetical protein